jgi:hypothetical protein
MAGSVVSSPATAFVGLSDKQADEISEYIKCKTYLLRGDLTSFEADPDCGHGPVAFDLKSLASGSSSGSGQDSDDCHESPPPAARPLGLIEDGGGYCYPEY